MAKSKSFFGLRTGSTKSLTFQVYRGQQITKDRVYRVSNPRTMAQMTQRALIPIVAAARSALKGLVDHSFEGVAYGDASLTEFSKQNLRAGALTVTSYSPIGVSNAGFADLIVSNGSLNVPDCTVDITDDETTFIPAQKFPAFKFPKAEGGDSADAIIRYLETYARDNNVAIIAPGTQLSFLTIYKSGTVKVGSLDVPTSGFAIDRLYIPNGDSDSANAKEINEKWKVFSAIAQDGDTAKLVNLDGDLLTISCKEGMDGNGFINISSSPRAAWENHTNCGMALILSRYENGIWKRSPSRLFIADNFENKYTFEDWLSTYQTTSAASQKYLNTGDESTGIRG